MKCLPSGRKNGQRCEVCCVVSRLVASTGVPPAALTRISPDCVLGENRMTPPGPHAPPRPKGASAMICGESPLISMVLSLPSAKNPRERLSGAQKGKTAFSVPASSRETRELTGRTQSVVLPSACEAVKAIDAPSGESTGGPAESPVRLSVVLSGGLMTLRMDGDGAAGGWSRNPTAAPKDRKSTRAAIQIRRGRFSVAGWDAGCGGDTFPDA